MKTVDISGFGGLYEFTSQRMLANGIKWLKAHPEFEFEKAYKMFENVHGACFPENKLSEELDAAILEGVDDATGGQHHTIIFHLTYIHRAGYERWFLDISEKQPERIYEFDGTIDSCPPGYIPKPGDGPKEWLEAGKKMGERLKREGR